MYRVWLSVLLYWLIQQGVDATLSPSGPTVSVDCRSQQTFTCSVTGVAAQWTITGLDEIIASGDTGQDVDSNNNRVNTTDISGVVQTSTITITGFTTADNGGNVQCIDQASSMVQGMATVSVGVPFCPTTVNVMDRSSDFSSATITWEQPTNSPSVTSYNVTCNPSCTASAMNCTSGSSICRVLSVSPCEDYSLTVLPMNSCGSSTGCTGNVVPVPSQGPPQCGQVGVIYGNDACPSFTFTRQGNFLPSTVMVSYQQLVGGSSSAGSMNCSYPVDPQMCRLVVPGGTYSFTLTPLNSCGSPSSTCPLITETIPDDCRQSPPPTAPTPTVSIGLIAGVSVGGVVGVIVVGVSGYGITILIMGFTCYSSLGFLALLKCLCCPCSEGKARKSSSKQRIDSASPVTPPAQPPAQPPSDEYADPQAIRDRKERGKEDKDKIQYAAIDFSAGAGSGAGEVKIHQKEEPVIYTAVQHV